MRYAAKAEGKDRDNAIDDMFLSKTIPKIRSQDSKALRNALEGLSKILAFYPRSKSAIEYLIRDS